MKYKKTEYHHQHQRWLRKPFWELTVRTTNTTTQLPSAKEINIPVRTVTQGPVESPSPQSIILLRSPGELWCPDLFYTVSSTKLNNAWAAEPTVLCRKIHHRVEYWDRDEVIHIAFCKEPEKYSFVLYLGLIVVRINIRRIYIHIG